MDSQIASTKQFFKSHHITLSDEWLESCLEWYREEHPNSNYSSETLHQKVYEQWLLLDLRETEIPILPLNLGNQQKMILNGVFSLQLLYVIDISQPKLALLQKMRNMTLNATDDEYHTYNAIKRMLQLTLTDGVQEVEAIEYKQIPTLKLGLAPGAKIRITGPVVVRRGQLLLESQNVEILGGEVEELLVSNAAENILAGELNLPLNPQPTVKLDGLIATENIVHSVSNNINVANQNIVFKNTINLEPFTSSSSTSEGTRNIPFQSNITSYTSNPHNVTSSSDIFKPKPNVGKSVTSQNSMIAPPCSNNQKFTMNNMYSSSHNPSEIFQMERCIDDEELMIIQECDYLLEIERDLEMEQKLKQEDLKNVSLECDTNCFENEATVDVFEQIDIDTHLDLIDQQMAKNSLITTISELIVNNTTNGKFTIKAKFNSVSAKLYVNNIQWSLRITVKDDTGEIESWVDSDVITKIINCSPATMAAFKEDIRNNKPGTHDLVMQKINELRTKIEQLDCIMDITFKSTEQYPSITNIN